MAGTRPRRDWWANGRPHIRMCGSDFTTGGMLREFGRRCRPWTRLANVDLPSEQKPMSDLEVIRQLDPKSLRAYLKDGNFGGRYQRDDEEMMKVWRTGVEETRELLN